MSEDDRSQFRQQLPKKPKITIEKILITIASLSSILGFLCYIFDKFNNQKIIEILYTISLLSLNLVLIIYIIYRERGQLYRYSEAVIFCHYVNHIIRDYLLEIRNQKEIKIDKFFLQNILDAISDCFSVIKGKKCRATLKRLDLDTEVIKTLARDRMSEESLSKYIERHNDQIAKINHALNDNTDFFNLWYGLEGCSRYYISNNLYKNWKAKDKNGDRKYKNSSFNYYGDPTFFQIGNFEIITNWTLPYKSTIVLPIKKDLHFFGFLCIDSNKRWIFNKLFDPELGGNFADILYILFKDVKLLQINKNLDFS